MELLDPATGAPLPPDAIQRVLFVAPRVHVYAIPPLTSMRGHVASSWTSDPSREIFAARMRVLETSYDDAAASTSTQQQQLKVDIVLEDPANGQLFAAAPYADPAAVEPATDSSRFFALTVRDPAGRKATLGVGFEERPEAFDFAVALQEARRGLGLEGGGDQGRKGGKGDEKTEEGTTAAAPAKDYSLKEGETITVNIGGKFGRRRQQAEEGDAGASLQSFALAPPPPPPSSSSSAASKSEGSGSSGAGGGGGFALPPPPSAQDVKSKRKSLMAMGFDDGQFGEFA